MRSITGLKKMSLYPYQNNLIASVWDEMREKKNAVLLQAPTGAGKTIIAAAMIAQLRGCYGNPHAQQNDTTIGYLAHRLELLMQPTRALCRHGILPRLFVSDKARDVIYAYLHETSEQEGWEIPSGGFTPGVWVGSIQRIAMRQKAGKPIPAPPKFLFVDEAHHIAAKTWTGYVNVCKNGSGKHARSRVIGMSATPERADKKSLIGEDGIFDSVVYGPSLAELVDRGFLSFPRVLAPQDAQIDTSKLTIGKDGDYNKNKSASAAMALRGDVVAHFKKHRKGKAGWLCFCVSIAHAQSMAQVFRDNGLRADCVDGQMSEGVRAGKIRALANFELDILCSCDVISEGMDVPAVEGAILLRATKSRTIYMQQIGRTLRIAPGKSEAIILDHAGLTREHGHVLYHHRYRPEGGEFKDKDPSIGAARICPAPGCGFANEPSAVRCKNIVAGKICGCPLVNHNGKKRKAPQTDLTATLEETIGRTAIQEFWNRLQAGEIRATSEEDMVLAARDMELPESWISDNWDRIKFVLNWSATPLGEFSKGAPGV